MLVLLNADVKFHCNDQSGELASCLAPLLALPASKLNILWLNSTLNFLKPEQIMKHEQMEFWLPFGSMEIGG